MSDPRSTIDDLSAEGTEADHTPRRWIVAMVVLAFVGLRFLLPLVDTDVQTVYDRIVWALTEQENWGKQALVGALDYPPLPALVLLVFSPLGDIGPRLVLAICQIWTLCYLYRTVHLYGGARRWPVLLLLLVAAFGRAAPAAMDPHWVLFVLFGSIYYHLCRWELRGALRDLVVIAICCSLLALGGITGLATGAAVLATIWIHSPPSTVRRRGVAPLLFAPVVYVAVLCPLINLLIMGDALFFADRIWQLAKGNAIAPTAAHLAFGAAAVGLLLIGNLVRLGTLRTHLLVNLVGATLAVALFGDIGQLYVGAEHLLFAFSAIALIHVIGQARPCAAERSPEAGPEIQRRHLGPILAAAVLVPAALVFRPAARERAQFVEAPPSTTELVTMIDGSLWEDSRVIILDLRSAAIYAGTSHNRFLPRLDFHEAVLRDQLAAEQLHLLVPPNNGKFYGRRSSVLAQIHERGEVEDWLFLEKEWPSGWQLWRCVRPRPTDHPG
jgi:hypothetical protein